MVRMLDHDSLADLEQHIIDFQTNGFVANVYAVVKGTGRRYELSFVEEGNRIPFRKEDQYSGKHGSAFRDYEDVNLRWS